MPDFRAKMHQKSISSETPLGSLQRSPDSIAGFGGPTSKGREGERKGGKGKEGKGELEDDWYSRLFLGYALIIRAAAFWTPWNFRKRSSAATPTSRLLQ